MSSLVTCCSIGSIVFIFLTVTYIFGINTSNKATKKMEVMRDKNENYVLCFETSFHSQYFYSYYSINSNTELSQNIPFTRDETLTGYDHLGLYYDFPRDKNYFWSLITMHLCQLICRMPVGKGSSLKQLM